MADSSETKDPFAHVLLSPEGSRGEEYPFDVEEKLTEGRSGHPKEAGVRYYVVKVRLDTLREVLAAMSVTSVLDMSKADDLRILEGAPYAHLGLHEPADDGIYEYPRTALSRGLHVKMTGDYRDRILKLLDELEEIIGIEDMKRFINPLGKELPEEVVVTLFPDRMCR
jgi:hypothetical protein